MATADNLDLETLSLTKRMNATTLQSSSSPQGWGSKETRKAYSSLESLVDCQAQVHKAEKTLVPRSDSTTSNLTSVTTEQQSSQFYGSDDEMDFEDNFW